MPLPLLSDVRVLEFASMVSGPFCGRLMAFSGAEVIKVELPYQGDPSRSSEPFAQDNPGPDSSLLFQYLNANKKSVTLDPSVPTGRDLLKKLIAGSDVLIEDHPPGYMDTLGLAYADLAVTSPRLVVASITSFGQYGRYSGWKAHNLNTTHISGSGSITPPGLSRRMFPTGPPLKMGGHIGDYYCGVTAATAVMFALVGRGPTGPGQHIDMSKQEAHMSLERNMINMWANYGYLLDQDKQDFHYGGCFPCKDGFVEILAHEDLHWHSLVRMMGNPLWAIKDAYSERANRRMHGPEINEGITSWTKKHGRAYIYRQGMRFGVPVGPYSTAQDVVRSKHEKARGYFTKIINSNVPRLSRIPSLPYKLSGLPAEGERRAPTLGEHNREIYCGQLGLRMEDLVKLAQAEIV